MATLLQAKFAARLRTTPEHQRAVRSHKTATEALARAKRMVAVTKGQDTYWVDGVEFWTRWSEHLADDIRWADQAAERHIRDLEDSDR